MSGPAAAMQNLPPEFWLRTAAAVAPRVGLPGLGVPFELAGSVTEYGSSDARFRAYRAAKEAEASGKVLTPDQDRALREGLPRTGGQIAGSTLPAVEGRLAQAEKIREQQRQTEQIRPFPVPPQKFTGPQALPPLIRPTSVPSDPFVGRQSAAQLAQLAKLLASLESRG